VELAKRDGSLASLKALLLIDMIGDRDLDIRRDTNSTPWLTNVIWETAAAEPRRLLSPTRRGSRTTTCRSWRPASRRGHHRPRLRGVAHREGHARRRQRRSLQVVGDVVLGALPHIEAHLQDSS
jgi:hypothetical protein